ncbi:hypothetical protein BC832DRAFT_482830 [Gaertneriomyces semiglobifer]|nr:hypothetical protein BC832DRAFT_482830 [Gaertneriomyces semiglobifer]
MAKGLRSKSERRNRAALREKVFGPVEQARLDRLVNHLNEHTSAQEATMKIDEPTPQTTEPSEEVERGRTAVVETEKMTMDVDGQASGTVEDRPMTKLQKEKLFMSRNAFKKKMKARGKSTFRKKAKR